MQSLNSLRPQLGHVNHNRQSQRLPPCWHWITGQPCRSAAAARQQPQQHQAHALQVAAVAAVSPEVSGTAADHTTPAAAAQQNKQQQQQQRNRQQGARQQPDPNAAQGTYSGRLLIKQQPPSQGNLPASLSQLRGSLPRGVTAASYNPQQQQQLPAQQHQQQPSQQRQQQQRQGYHGGQSLLDKNMSFSGALKHLQGLEEWLLLLESAQWGPGLADLDAVSVVGALVWLVKSREWQAVSSRQASSSSSSSDGVQGAWQQRRRGQAAIELLLSRAAQLVTPAAQHNPSSSSSSNAQPPATASGGSSSNSGFSTAAAAAAAAPLMRPAELAALIYSTSKLGQQRPQLLAAAAAALSQDLYACSTTELFRLIWGLATARVNPGDPWLLNFCKAAQAKFFMCEPPQLAIMVYGLARLGYRPPDVWIADWLETSEPLLSGFSAQNLSNAAWGLSCWRFQAPDHWLSSFYTASAAALPDMAPIGISQMQLAVVTLGGGTPPPQSWLAGMVGTAQPLFCQMELLQLCNFGWALAQWRACPPAEVMSEYLEATRPLLAAATATDLSTLLWICDKLSFIPQQQWLEAWFAAAAASLPRCEPQHLTTIALVLGRWGLVPVPGFSVEYWRCSKARFKDFSAYQMALLVWGLGKARRTVPKTWASALLATFCQLLLREAEPTDVCRLIGGLSHVIVKPNGCRDWVLTTPGVQQQLQHLCDWLQPQLGGLEPQRLVVLVRGLSGLGFSVEPGFLRAFSDAAAQLDERLTPQQRKLLLHEFGRLKRSSSGGGGGNSSSGFEAGEHHLQAEGSSVEQQQW